MYVDFDDWECHFLDSATKEGWNLFSLGTPYRPLLLVGDPDGDVADDGSINSFRDSYARSTAHAIAAYDLLKRASPQEFECLGMRSWASA